MLPHAGPLACLLKEESILDMCMYDTEQMDSHGKIAFLGK